MDKSWMQKSRVSREYLAGIEEFIKYAIEHNAVIEGRLKCPCTYCNNVHYQTITEFREHAVVKGIHQNYTTWFFHGERASTSASIGEQSRGQIESTRLDDVGTMLHDAFGIPSFEGSSSAPKKKRGKTRLTKLFAGPSKNVRVNRRNQPVSTEATDLANFLGTSVRDGRMAPIQYKDWRDMPVEYKNALWEMAKDKFNLSDDQYGWVLNSLNLKWKEHKCDLKRKLFKVYDNDADMIANKDPDVLHDQLAILIEHWRSENAQKRAKINEENRAKHKMPHTAGSKSFARIIDEQEIVLGHEPSRAQIFIKTHTRKDGTPVNDVSRATIEQLQERMSQVPDASEDANVRNDIFSEVLGPEPRGRVRGLGLGASQSVWSQPSTRASSSSNEDKAAIASLQTKVNELQGQLQWMMEMWQREHPGSHPPGSHPLDLSQ